MTVKEHIKLVKYAVAKHEAKVEFLKMDLDEAVGSRDLWKERAFDTRALYHKTRLVFCMQTMKYMTFNPEGADKDDSK